MNDIRTEADTFCARTAATTATWLERNYRAGPFFLWVDFFDPHEPWDPPEYLVRRYDPDYDGPPMLHPNYGPADRYSAAELRNLWAHYAAEAELVDRHIGRVLGEDRRPRSVAQFAGGGDGRPRHGDRRAQLLRQEQHR